MWHTVSVSLYCHAGWAKVHKGNHAELRCHLSIIHMGYMEMSLNELVLFCCGLGKTSPWPRGPRPMLVERSC